MATRGALARAHSAASGTQPGIVGDALRARLTSLLECLTEIPAPCTAEHSSSDAVVQHLASPTQFAHGLCSSTGPQGASLQNPAALPFTLCGPKSHLLRPVQAPNVEGTTGQGGNSDASSSDDEARVGGTQSGTQQGGPPRHLLAEALATLRNSDRVAQLTPDAITRELDKHIIGQEVCVRACPALLNCALHCPELSGEVLPCC